MKEVPMGVRVVAADLREADPEVAAFERIAAEVRELASALPIPGAIVS
jgi:hypothetical protein